MPPLAAIAPPGAAAPRPLRVVVLDDDAVFRTVLSRMLARLGAEVVATCSTIGQARARLMAGDVDAVTVDVVLRGESGLTFLRWVREAYPKLLTVLVTAGTERGARTGVDAMFLGASALLTKPAGAQLPAFEAELRRVLLDGRAGGGQRALVKPSSPALKPELRRELLAIGASTGGPAALLRVLTELPTWMDAPIVITQHMASLHLTYFIEHLGQQLSRPVALATDGARLQRGRVYLAGNDRHLLIERQQGRLFARTGDTPPEHHCRPAVDPMFCSVAAACPGTALAVVLTGMGSDGARGARELRQRGNPVLVQDEFSSVVFGMPNAVMQAGAADAVVSLEAMGASILEWMAWKEASNS